MSATTAGAKTSASVQAGLSVTQQAPRKSFKTKW